jgi:hypothetical protein
MKESGEMVEVAGEEGVESIHQRDTKIPSKRAGGKTNFKGLVNMNQLDLFFS